MAETKMCSCSNTLSLYFTAAAARPPHRVFPFANGVSFDSLKPPRSREDGLLYVEADPSGGDTWKLDPVVQLLKERAVGVIPTDTLYVCFFNLATYTSIIYLFNLLGVASVIRVVLSLNMVY
uniref:YrdC-like domain-containing protein n=1 Tax=Manihot esculenta TaxID=3983 RepID=A0A2C9UHD9_MANES